MPTTQEMLKALDDFEKSHHEARRHAILELADAYKQLQAENEKYQNALLRLSSWAKAYPLEAFPEPDFVEVRKALKEHGISLDAVSASNMRHVIKGVSDIVEQALKKSV